MLSCHRPCSRHICAGVRKRADNGHRALARQREKPPFVLKQHVGFAGNAARDRTVLIAIHEFCSLFLLTELVRIVEQAELVLRFEHAAHRLIHRLHRDLAFVQAGLRLGEQSLCDHIHVHAGVQRADAHLVIVPHSVHNALGDAGVVRDHEAVPSPLLAQNVGQQPLVHRCGNVVHHIERGHERAGACVGRSLVTGHVLVEHALVRHVHGVVVAAGLSAAVEREMLDAGHNLVRSGELLARAALVAVDHRLGDAGVQVRVLAAALADTSPARVASEVHHRAEGPRNTVYRSLHGRDVCGLLDRSHIPGAGQSERNREGGLIAMDNVHAEDQRNPEPRLLHRYLLVAADFGGALDVEQAAYLALGDAVFHAHALPFSGDDVARDGKVQLAGLFFDGHLGHEFGDEAVHLLI